MEFKLDTTVRDANIFIYGKLSPEATALILHSKIHLPQNSQMIHRMQQDGGRLWLIRESRMDGLLTVQSASFDQQQGFWKENNYERYMLSRNHGWMRNGKDGIEFDTQVKDAGGIIKMTGTNAAPFVTALLKLLSTQGYLTKNRINPGIGEETTIQGYSKYVDNGASVMENSFYHRAHGSSNLTQAFFQSERKAGETAVSLPEGILMALSCPLTTWKTGEIQLMQDPVIFLKDGITYERRYLELCSNVTLQEGVDYYPNIKLKSIINYVSATHLTLEDYLAKLAKVAIDILDPVDLVDMTNPVLSPSGLSYEKSTLDAWIKTCLAVEPENSDRPITDPLTQENIRGKQLVENSNLKLFIKFWPDFYESRKSIQAGLTL